MRGKGINYDTGFLPGSHDSRPVFDQAVVAAEMRIIARELGCTAVRVSGSKPERISAAAQAAAAEGLEVWFAPFPPELTTAELIELFRDCADRAEHLRREGARVVLVTGCELSLFNPGFLPGASSYERIARLGKPSPQMYLSFARLPKRLNAFLAEARDASNARSFRAGLRKQFRHGKPVVATEYGCCPYAGAADKGGLGWDIADYDDDGVPTLRGEFQRDESEQVRYLKELNQIFAEEGLDLAFWFTFAGYHQPASPDPRRDVDLASYGLVSMLPEGPGSGYQGLGWRPRLAFEAMASLKAASRPE
jgi:hypothetical protein